jgi:hypothetical protein
MVTEKRAIYGDHISSPFVALCAWAIAAAKSILTLRYF